MELLILALLCGAFMCYAVVTTAALVAMFFHQRAVNADIELEFTATHDRIDDAFTQIAFVDAKLEAPGETH